MSYGCRFIFAVLSFVFLVTAVSCRHDGQRSSSSTAAAFSASKDASPTGLASGRDGTIYVALRAQNRIIEIPPHRRTTTVVGDGRAAFSGDGGPANQASLNGPLGIALDSAGNLFIADTGNNRVRRVDADTHTITTVAGNGSFMGGGTGKIATVTVFTQPTSVAVDADGNMYVGQTTGIGVKRVDAITHIATKVVGAGLPGDSSASEPASGPFWIALDERGTLFYSDPSRNTVSQVDFPENNVQTIAGSAVCGSDGDGGAGTAALLCFPEALSVRTGKAIFIADAGNNRIRRLDLVTGMISTAAGNGRAGSAGDGGQAVNASLNGPMGIAVDASGNLYIADTGNNSVRQVRADTGIITTLENNQDLVSAGSSDSEK